MNDEEEDDPTLGYSGHFTPREVWDRPDLCYHDKDPQTCEACKRDEES